MSNDLSKKIINNEDLNLSEIEKENAIKKEKYYRELYNEIWNFSTTKSFADLVNMLITGYDCMLVAYKDKTRAQGDIDYLIKFAFRDFYLLMFINMKEIFDNDEFLKEFHRQVYTSENYIQQDEFKELVKYCKDKIRNDAKK